MDFSDKTKDDLREIIRTATEALNEYDEREKTPVYALFVPFVGWNSWISKKKAIIQLREYIEDDMIFGDDEMKLPFQAQIKFYSKAELQYCEDYKLKHDE